MADISLIIIHFDDQPDLVSWMPRSLENWLWRHLLGELSEDSRMEENEDETDFTIHLGLPGQKIVLRYLIFVDAVAARAAMEAHKAALACLILDQAIGADFYAGSAFFQTVERECPEMASRTFMLTAYPRETCEALGWGLSDPRLMVKPPDRAELRRRLLTMIADKCTNAAIAATINKIAKMDG